jgi:prolyl oligopeptidase
LTTDLIKAFLDYKEGIFSLYLKIKKDTNEKLILIMAVLPTIASFGQNQKSIQYPERGNGRFHFDAKVADPYRWLEDDRSAETAAWVEAENKVTYGYLNQIPFRDALKNRMEKLWN